MKLEGVDLKYINRLLDKIQILYNHGYVSTKTMNYLTNANKDLEKKEKLIKSIKNNMKLEDLEKIEEAVQLMYPSRAWMFNYRNDDLIKEERMFWDQKTLYYIRAGVDPDELLTAAKVKVEERKKQKEEQMAAQKKAEEEQAKMAETCTHDWHEIFRRDNDSFCGIMFGATKLWKKECSKCNKVIYFD